MRYRLLILLLPLLLSAERLMAQAVSNDDGWILATERVREDSLRQAAEVKHQADSIAAEAEFNSWRPDPMRAVWMGAIIPGYGQIYNRSYWKLPIVYGAFMGCAYAITWTNGLYSDYKTAYRDIATDPYYDPTDPEKSYVAILPKGYTIESTGTGGSMGGKAKYTTTLQSNMNSYRRYRDISIVATVIVYALTLIDAYVDAQLYDFDISPDLSLNIEPQVTRDPLSNKSAELKVAFKLK